MQFAAWRVKLLDVGTETDFSPDCGWFTFYPRKPGWLRLHLCVFAVNENAVRGGGAADVLGWGGCHCAGRRCQRSVSVDRSSHYPRLAPNWSSSWRHWKAVGYEKWRLLTLAAARLTITVKMTWLSWLTWETFRSSRCPSSSYRSATLASVKRMWAALHPVSSPNMAKVRCASPKLSASIVYLEQWNCNCRAWCLELAVYICEYYMFVVCFWPIPVANRYWHKLSEVNLFHYC